MKYTAFIFARGGSKGLQNKNLKNFSGQPLISWSIIQALKIDRIGRVIVSTDSSDIAEVAKEYGAEVPFIRPSELATDDSPELLSWRHALRFLEKNEGKMPKELISIPATSPLRSSDDVNKCIDLFEKTNSDVVLAVTESKKNPSFNMVKFLMQHEVNLVLGNNSNIYRRQDSPAVYDVTTVCYIAKSEFILENETIFSGKVRAVLIPQERSIDIDNSLDFRIAEYLFKEKKSEGNYGQ